MSHGFDLNRDSSEIQDGLRISDFRIPKIWIKILITKVTIIYNINIDCFNYNNVRYLL